MNPFKDFTQLDWSFITNKSEALILWDDHQVHFRAASLARPVPCAVHASGDGERVGSGLRDVGHSRAAGAVYLCAVQPNVRDTDHGGKGSPAPGCIWKYEAEGKQ